MGVLERLEKVLLSGKKVNSASTPKKESVISRVVSYLRVDLTPKYIIKIPLNRPIGKVFYTVQSTIEPVTFNKKKDAEAFKKLLAVSTGEIKADIIRREVTKEGYEPTY
jgi:hypothetical protein